MSDQVRDKYYTRALYNSNTGAFFILFITPWLVILYKQILIKRSTVCFKWRVCVYIFNRLDIIGTASLSSRVPLTLQDVPFYDCMFSSFVSQTPSFQLHATSFFLREQWDENYVLLGFFLAKVLWPLIGVFLFSLVFRTMNKFYRNDITYIICILFRSFCSSVVVKWPPHYKDHYSFHFCLENFEHLYFTDLIGSVSKFHERGVRQKTAPLFVDMGPRGRNRLIYGDVVGGCGITYEGKLLGGNHIVLVF